jgi:hypothetical protein
MDIRNHDAKSNRQPKIRLGLEKGELDIFDPAIEYPTTYRGTEKSGVRLEAQGVRLEV